MNNDDQPPKIIPSKFDKNDDSPTEEKIVRIDKNGNVEFFIRCGGWCYNEQCLYYKFSFKVNQNIYNDDYDTVEKFVDAIQGTQINELTVSILRPKPNLDFAHRIPMKGKKIQNIKKTTIKDILDDMKDIGKGSWTNTMVSFLIKNRLKKDATELFNKELNEELLNKNKQLEKQLKESEEKFTLLLNKTKEDFNKRLEENGELIQQQIKENEELKQQIKENEQLEQKLKKINKDLKGPLYRPKDKGFLSIFSCCTCGLDKVAEMEEGKNEMNINS